MPRRTAVAIARLVDAELAQIADQRVRLLIQALRVPPTCHMRQWDYGLAGEQYACWTVAVHAPSGSAIVFSDDGFGPQRPWGLVGIDHLWFGMDRGWFATLEEAVRESFAWSEAAE
ncbi:MAG TPA: hypothetical protein VGE07_10205 [Herpetosiphonaceae bacterium]